MSLVLDSKRQQDENDTMEYLDPESQRPHHKNLQTIIVTLHGGETQKEVHDLEKMRVKIQRRESHLSFLK